MAYRSAVVEDRVLFFLSDTDILELNSYDKVQTLVNASQDNLEQLINEIKANLVSSAQEEIDIMQSIDNPILTKTLAYAKLMQVVSYYFYQQERERLDEEKKREHEASESDWSWTG